MYSPGFEVKLMVTLLWRRPPPMICAKPPRLNRSASKTLIPVIKQFEPLNCWQLRSKWEIGITNYCSLFWIESFHFDFCMRIVSQQFNLRYLVGMYGWHWLWADRNGWRIEAPIDMLSSLLPEIRWFDCKWPDYLIECLFDQFQWCSFDPAPHSPVTNATAHKCTTQNESSLSHRFVFPLFWLLSLSFASSLAQRCQFYGILITVFSKLARILVLNAAVLCPFHGRTTQD